MEPIVREVITYRSYFLDFYAEQPEKVQSKIEWTLQLIRVMKYVPEKYFKHMEGTKGLYEARVEAGGNIYRIFSFFDKEIWLFLAMDSTRRRKRLRRMKLTGQS